MVYFQTSDSPWKTLQKGLAVKVNLRSEIVRLGLIVRVGGLKVRGASGVAPGWCLIERGSGPDLPDVSAFGGVV